MHGSQTSSMDLVPLDRELETSAVGAIRNLRFLNLRMHRTEFEPDAKGVCGGFLASTANT